MDAHYTFLFLSTCVNWYTFFCPPGQGSWSLATNTLFFTSVRSVTFRFYQWVKSFCFPLEWKKKYCLQNHVKQKVDVKHSLFLFQLMSSFKTMQPYKSSFYWYLLHDMTEEGRYMWHGNERKGRLLSWRIGILMRWRKEAWEASVEAGFWKNKGQSLINTSWSFLSLQSPSIF